MLWWQLLICHFCGQMLLYNNYFIVIHQLYYKWAHSICWFYKTCSNSSVDKSQPLPAYSTNRLASSRVTTPHKPISYLNREKYAALPTCAISVYVCCSKFKDADAVYGLLMRSWIILFASSLLSDVNNRSQNRGNHGVLAFTIEQFCSASASGKASACLANL